MHGVEARHYRRGVVVEPDRRIVVQYRKRIGLDVVHRKRACVDSCRIDGTAAHIDTELCWLKINCAATAKVRAIDRTDNYDLRIDSVNLIRR